MANRRWSRQSLIGYSDSMNNSRGLRIGNNDSRLSRKANAQYPAKCNTYRQTLKIAGFATSVHEAATIRGIASKRNLEPLSGLLTSIRSTATYFLARNISLPFSPSCEWRSGNTPAGARRSSAGTFPPKHPLAGVAPPSASHSDPVT